MGFASLWFKASLKSCLSALMMLSCAEIAHGEKRSGYCLRDGIAYAPIGFSDDDDGWMLLRHWVRWERSPDGRRRLGERGLSTF